MKTPEVKITILSKDFKVITRGLSVTSAAQYVGCATVTLYKASRALKPVNDYYVLRAGDVRKTDLVFCKAIELQVTRMSGGRAKKILKQCLADLKELGGKS